MSVVGKMVMCRIGFGDDVQTIYGEWDDLKKGGIYEPLEKLAEMYMECCLALFVAPNENKRAELVTYLHESLWRHIQGVCPITDIRANFPILDEIKKEWDKLSESDQWYFLD